MSIETALSVVLLAGFVVTGAGVLRSWLKRMREGARS
jgi:hypothetical protein